VAAYVAYLTGRCRLSKRQVVELFEDMFGTAISLGSVCSIEQDVAAALAAPVEEAREAVRQQTIIHADETGWREDKKKAWLWVAATSVAIVFKVARSRGAIEGSPRGDIRWHPRIGPLERVQLARRRTAPALLGSPPARHARDG
jgi:transposase